MNILDNDLFELLNNINSDKTKSINSFFNICKFTIPDQKSDNVLNKLIWSGHVIFNEKEKTIIVSNSGNKFIKNHKNKLKRNSFIEYSKFIKEIRWLIGFAFSIILNVFFIIRYILSIF